MWGGSILERLKIKQQALTRQDLGSGFRFYL